jgi:drug/metabolite transporter (DMT)-like permease
LPFFLFRMQWPLSIITWFYIAGVGVATAVGQICLTIAYRHGSAAFLSPLSYFIVIFSSLISIIVFNTTPHLSTFIGMVLIIFGGSMSFIILHKGYKVLGIFLTHENRFWKKILSFLEKKLK